MRKILINSVILAATFCWAAAPGPVQAMLVAHPGALYEQGMAELRSYHGEADKLKRAEQAFDTILKKFPDSPFGYLGMSQVKVVEAYRHGSYYDMNIIRKDALPMAIQALELGASIREVHEHYAVLEKIYEDFGSFQDEIQADLLARPNDAETLFKVGEFLCNQGAFRTAIDYYTTALERNPDPGLRVRMLKQLGIIHLEQLHQPQSAMDYFTQALSDRAGDPVLFEYRGTTYLEQRMYSKAVDEFTRSQEILPTRTAETQLAKARGYLLEEEGRFREAIDQLLLAARTDALDPVLQFRLGNLYFQVKDFQRAHNHFRRVIDMGSGDADIYYLAGRSADSSGNHDQAIRYYREYLQLEGDGQEASWIRANFPELSHR